MGLPSSAPTCPSEHSLTIRGALEVYEHTLSTWEVTSSGSKLVELIGLASTLVQASLPLRQMATHSRPAGDLGPVLRPPRLGTVSLAPRIFAGMPARTASWLRQSEPADERGRTAAGSLRNP